MNNRSENELKQMVAEAVRQYQAVESGAESSPMHEPVAEMSSAEAARLIDHTLLKPEATEAQIRQLCEEAKAYQFASVCVNPTWVALCRTLLIDSPVKVCTVVGFPLGATLPEVKSEEAERAIQSGAHEVDMVINVGRLKSGDHQSVFQDIISVVGTAHRSGAVVKAIIETALLTEDEKVAACVLAQAAGVDFVKTSTGFSGGGATVADVALMRRVVGPELGVKAAGGVRTAASLRSMVAAGATRIGASSSVQIINEFMAQKDGGDAADEDAEADDSQSDSAPIQETGEMY